MRQVLTGHLEAANKLPAGFEFILRMKAAGGWWCTVSHSGTVAFGVPLPADASSDEKAMAARIAEALNGERIFKCEADTVEHALGGAVAACLAYLADPPGTPQDVNFGKLMFGRLAEQDAEATKVLNARGQRRLDS